MKRQTTISINVILLGIVSFLNDLSSEIITPILPLFIASLGGAGIATGIIGGARDSITSLLKVVSGYISDKTGKRKLLVFSGYFTSSVFRALLAIAKTWQQVLVFVGLERIGKGLRDAPRDAIIAQSMPEAKGKAFGIHRAFDSTGAVLGSILAFVLFHFMGFEFQKIILLAAAIAFTSLIPLWFVKKTKVKKKAMLFKASLLELPKELKLFLVIAALFALANFSYMFFILKAQVLFGKTRMLGTPLLLYVLYNIFYAGSSAPFGYLSDKIGRKKVLLLGYSLFTITTLGMALFSSLFAYIILFAIYGIVKGIIDGNQRAFVADLSKESAHGTSLGAYHTTIGLAALPASIIAGSMWQLTPSATFFYGAVMSAVAAGAFFVTRKQYG